MTFVAICSVASSCFFICSQILKEMVMLKDLLAKPEVEHIREGLHRKFLSSSKFQDVFVDGLQVAAVSSLRELPVKSEGVYFITKKLMFDHLGGLPSATSGVGILGFPPTAVCLRIENTVLK